MRRAASKKFFGPVDRALLCPGARKRDLANCSGWLCPKSAGVLHGTGAERTGASLDEAEEASSCDIDSKGSTMALVIHQVPVDRAPSSQ